MVDFVSDDDVGDAPHSLGGLGGWVRESTRWADYEQHLTEQGREKELPYARALRDYCIENDCWISGDEHQNFEGTPLFDDGSVAGFSWRGWGDIMAAAWNHAGKQPPADYMDFYMSTPED